MHINEHPCWFISTSVVCSVSVFSTLISSDVNDSQSLSFSDLTSFHILPKAIYRRSPCDHIALLCHISTFLHCYVLYLFHSSWNWKGWTEKRSFLVRRNKSTSKSTSWKTYLASKLWINNFGKPVDWSSLGNEIFQIKPVLSSPWLYLLTSIGYKRMTPSNWIHLNPIKVKFDLWQSAHIFGKEPVLCRKMIFTVPFTWMNVYLYTAHITLKAVYNSNWVRSNVSL